MIKVDVEPTDYSARIAQSEHLESIGIDPYPAEPPKLTHRRYKPLFDGYDSLVGTEVSVAGRMVAKRVHGGITFVHIDDGQDQLQTVLTKARLTGKTPDYKVIKDNFGIGDFIAVEGVLQKTQTGEISVWAQEVTMLSKALRVAPLKISDSEIQQRQRYIHTLTDLEARQRFRIRSQLVQHMRDYFIGNLDALEVETPIMDSTYGGAAAKPFTTHHNALDTDFYLRIANELYLKRMTIGGYYEGVFEFSRDFRNEGMDRTHNPEFTQVELYIPYWDYNNMMDMAEELISSAAKKILGTTEVIYNGHQINLAKPWRRLTIYDGLRQKLGIEPTTISDLELAEIAHGHGVDVNTRGELILGLFEDLWGGELIQPTFVLDYPADTSALTKKHRTDPGLTERFETFVAGMEVMNCYTELNDPRDQRKRFELEVQKRTMGDQQAMPFDEDFILAQEYGMPQQAGIGISIDRFTMILTGADHIRQAIYFPTLRPLKLS